MNINMVWFQKTQVYCVSLTQITCNLCTTALTLVTLLYNYYYIFLDFKKAFDTVDQKILLSKFDFVRN